MTDEWAEHDRVIAKMKGAIESDDKGYDITGKILLFISGMAMAAGAVIMLIGVMGL